MGFQPGCLSLQLWLPFHHVSVLKIKRAGGFEPPRNSFADCRLNRLAMLAEWWIVLKDWDWDVNSLKLFTDLVRTAGLEPASLDWKTSHATLCIRPRKITRGKIWTFTWTILKTVASAVGLHARVIGKKCVLIRNPYTEIPNQNSGAKGIWTLTKSLQDFYAAGLHHHPEN